jgi:hypothetical protein
LTTYNKLYQDSNIQRNGVYVLGKVMSSSFGGDAGWANRIAYSYGNSIYEFYCTGGIEKNSDSLVFLHLNTRAPRQVRLVEGELVPSCLSYKKHSNNSWQSIPVCE